MQLSERHVPEVMVLTYEDAPMEETMPYFGCRLAPAMPNLFFGRSAKRTPKTQASQTVFDWFKDYDPAGGLVRVFGPNRQGGHMRFGARLKHPGNPRKYMLEHALPCERTCDPPRVLHPASGGVHIRGPEIVSR